MDRVDELLTGNVQAFTAFARKRLREPSLAEDVVQESLLKALRAHRKPAPDQNVVAWFYRILRRSIIDLYRTESARTRSLEKLAASLPEAPALTDERLICQCIKRLLPGLSAADQALLKQIDLQGTAPRQAAKELGLTLTALNVRLHRARLRLRKQLERNCRLCSRHGCLDCTC